MFHITHYYRNANQNNNEVAFHTGENATESLQTINAGQVVEKREPSCTVGGKGN